MKLHPLPEVIEDIRAGKLVVIVDDADRENEGDLMIAAEKTTAEAVNFMIQEGRGLICLSLSDDIVQHLGIPMQVTENTAALGTNFTVSIDHISAGENGVSASARAKAIIESVNPEASAKDFVMPGYIFPLRAVEGGVLKRRGQTEGSIDLCRLAGLRTGAVICEVMDERGLMLRGEELELFCRKYDLKITSVEEILQYRLRHEVSLRRVAEAEIENLEGLGIRVAKSSLKGFRLLVYVDDVDGKEHMVLIKGTPKHGSLARIHSECLTGDVFESARCDCGSQFTQALQMIENAGEGVLVYLYQEGRNIGLGNKLRAYELQDQGYDTVDANLELGFEADPRDYRAGAQILLDLGLEKVSLMTNNPEKVRSLEKFGIGVRKRVPISGVVDKYNREYLQTKRDRMGHLLP